MLSIITLRCIITLTCTKLCPNWNESSWLQISDLFSVEPLSHRFSLLSFCWTSNIFRTTWQWNSYSAFDNQTGLFFKAVPHSFPWLLTSTDMQRHCLTLCTLRCLKGGCRSGQSNCTVSCVIRCGLQKEQDWKGSCTLLWPFLPDPEAWARFCPWPRLGPKCRGM